MGGGGGANLSHFVETFGPWGTNFVTIFGSGGGGVIFV